MEDEKPKEEIKKEDSKKNYKRDLILGIVAVALGTLIFMMVRVVSAQPSNGCNLGFCNSSNFIPSTLANYNYQSNNTAYTLYLMNDSDLSKAVSFVANGYSFTFDTALSQDQYYNSTLGAVVGGVLNPAHTNISINGTVASYPNAWQNITLAYNITPNTAKENIIINNSGAIPANSSAADFFRFRTDLYYNSSLQVCVNGVCYLHPSSLSLNTTNEIDFKDSYNNTIFYLPPVTITDSNGSTVQGTYFSILNNGVDIWYIGVPTSFLKTAVYPIDIDPSIIEIINAEWLDPNRNFIENVYSNVSALDGVTALIPSGNYLRVVFSQGLTNTRDITIYASGDSPNDSVQVFEGGSNIPFATFSNVSTSGEYRILLTNLSTNSTYSQNTFDLLSNGNINYDYVVDPTWANTSYARCRNINITNNGTTALSNFPAFVNVSYLPSMQSNFNDIIFYNSSCNTTATALPFEIDNYSASKFADVWILTNITAGAGTNTTISMYYGNSTATSQQNSTAVWGVFNNYAAVYHLGDLGTGTRNDSTIFRNNATPTNFTGTETNSSGQIDGAITLNGSKFLESINNIGITGQQSNTITFWVNLRNISSNVREPMVSWGNATSNGAWLADVRSGVYFFWGFATGDWTTTGTPAINTWQYEAITFNGTTMNWSVNGKSIGTNARTPLVNASRVFIGYENDSGTIYALNGTIDEVEISNVTRSNDWINQSFYMQQNQSTYVIFGAEQLQNATPSSNLVSPPNANSSSNSTQLFRSNESAGASNYNLTNATLYIWNSTGSLVNSLSGNMWVTDEATHSVTEINATGAMVTYNGTGNNPYGIAYDGLGNMWVVNEGTTNATGYGVTKVNVVTGAMTNYTGTGLTPYAIAYDNNGSMWTANEGTTNATGYGVTKINITTGAMTNYTGTGNNPYDIVYDGNGSMWTQNEGSNSVTKINIATGAMTNYSIGTENFAYAMAFDGVNMWVTNAGSASVTVINSTGGSANHAGTGSNPHALAWDGANMWTANEAANSVTEINSTFGMVTYNGTGVNPGNGGSQGIAFDGVNMWTANTGSSSVTKITPGGTMTNYTATGLSTPYGIAFDGATLTPLFTSNFTVLVTGATSNSTNWTDTLPSSGTYSWNVYTCDNSPSCAFNTTNYTLVVSATACTYTAGSGNWGVSCSSNCVINANANLNYSNISFVGTGTVVILANLTNWTQIYKANGCTLYKPNRYALVGRH